jgi:hypothetical protein
MDYGFAHEGKVFTPNGTVGVPVQDNDARNREQEKAEIEWLKTAPEKLFLYVREPKRDKYERLGNGHWGEPEYRYAITTWLGTVVSSACAVGDRANVGFGFHTYRRSVDCTIFGTRYVGWYLESSGQYCRLRKAKVQ